MNKIVYLFGFVTLLLPALTQTSDNSKWLTRAHLSRKQTTTAQGRKIVYLAKYKNNEGKTYYTRVWQLTADHTDEKTYDGDTYYKKSSQTIVGTGSQSDATFHHYDAQWQILPAKAATCSIL